MGDAASRPTSVVTTTRIHGYPTLLRPRTFDTIVFRDLRWNVQVSPHRFNELGLPDAFAVSVEIDDRFHDRFVLGSSTALRGIAIGIEILDETEEHTVFQEPGWRSNGEHLTLVLLRRELEASSCVRNDRFTVRCTITTKQARAAQRNLSGSEELPDLVVDAMAGSHTLAVASFSKLRAALREGECVYSTHFSVGGCTWYLRFFPYCSGFSVYLVRASKQVDETPATAEFSFELEGLVNFESQKMTHTFHYVNEYIFRYLLEPKSTSAVYDDRLLVRCNIVVMPPAAAEIPISIPVAVSRIESILTPLLSAIYD